MDDLELFKEGFICGTAWPVVGFDIRQSIRCGEFVESQYYVFARKSKDLNVEICCFCGNDEDIMTAEQIAEKVDCGGRSPLPLCDYCLSQNITPPMVNATTNFLEKAKRDTSKRKRQLESAVSKGYRRGRGRARRSS